MADPTRSFDALWPDYAERLRTTLVARGVPAQDRDDVVQETALRVYRVWGDLDPDRSPWPFVVTVGLNYWRDVVRERIGHATDVTPPSAFELTDHTDVERDVLARAELATVGRAMQRLAPEQRRLLFANEEFNDVVRPLGASERMARMRARRQLARAVGRASVAALLVCLRRPARTAGMVATAYATAMATAVFTAPLVPMIVAPQHGSQHPGAGVASSAAHRLGSSAATAASGRRNGRHASAPAAAALPPPVRAQSKRHYGDASTQVCSPTNQQPAAGAGAGDLNLDVKIRSIHIYRRDGGGHQQELFKTPTVDANTGSGCVAVG